jgi:TolA-binding protein
MKHPAIAVFAIGIAIVFTMVTVQYAANNPQAVAQAIAPAGTHAPVSPQGAPQARYQVIDDLVTMRAQIDALDARVKELEWRQAYDRQQMALARVEDQKRITSLEVTSVMGCWR